MLLGLGKCAAVEVRRGKLMEEGNIAMVDGREIAMLTTEARYKYLGIQQTFEIKQQENKKHTETQLMERVRKVLRTQLSSKNKMEAINIWALPSLTYTAGVLTWSNTDLQRMDRRIQTTLVQHGLLHPNSATERLYLPRKEGGRGLKCLEGACRKEEEKLKAFFRLSNNPIHQWINSASNPPSSSGQASEGQSEAVSREDTLRQTWKAKPLHGRFHASLHQEDVDIQASNTYLTQGYLYPQTKGTLFAIQDQVVPTRSYTKHTIKQQIDSTKCRLCNNAEESVQHLSSGCSAIAGTKYLSRHDSMGTSDALLAEPHHRVHNFV
ncbi:uncharacterized protein LOC123322181 isoform X2 [Coccinella septempunctata]|uniref:uncharacterized protein LOC123322181 isoform X2 n=1 Tax=Coccinella septempunctata TaxID=41139 RepID=UPI001D07A3F1|nr:uncharacterized protein LOC123322181 isoform X2 [Coccinella septempunctata]